jgi:hypothetical protein
VSIRFPLVSMVRARASKQNLEFAFEFASLVTVEHPLGNVARAGNFSIFFLLFANCPWVTRAENSMHRDGVSKCELNKYLEAHGWKKGRNHTGAYIRFARRRWRNPCDLKDREVLHEGYLRLRDKCGQPRRPMCAESWFLATLQAMVQRGIKGFEIHWPTGKDNVELQESSSSGGEAGKETWTESNEEARADPQNGEQAARAWAATAAAVSVKRGVRCDESERGTEARSEARDEARRSEGAVSRRVGCDLAGAWWPRRRLYEYS